MSDFDLNDALDDLLGSEPVVRTTLRRPAPSAYSEPETYWDVCQKCGGTGSWGGRGTCYSCKGQGGKSFKTSAADRAAARDKVHDRKERDTQAWIEEHKAEYAWLVATAERQTDRLNAGEHAWQFPIDLRDAVTQYGSLTDNQLTAVRKCMEKDAARKAEWAKQDAERKANAPTVSGTKLEQAFTTAREKAQRPGQMGVFLKPLKLRNGGKDDLSAIDLVFSLAGERSKNPGAIYAKSADGRYLGKLQGGKFFAARECKPDESEAVRMVCEDPEQAAIAYGKAWSCCGICGQTLLNDASIARGIGPICAAKFGW